MASSKAKAGNAKVRDAQKKANAAHTASKSSDWKLYLLVAAAVVALAMLLATPRHSSSESQQLPKQQKEAGDTAKSAEQEDDNCEVLYAKANQELQKGRVQRALDKYMRCADRRPDDAAAHWRVGVLLARVKDYANALSWMEQAFKLEPDNSKYFAVLAQTAIISGNAEFARDLVEHKLETLYFVDQGTWRRTVLQSGQSSAEDLIWITDGSDKGVDLLKLLLKSYNEMRDLAAANAVYSILATLDPNNAALQQDYVDFSFGIGLYDQAMRAATSSLQRGYQQKYPHGDAYTVMGQQSLLLLTSGLDAHVVNLARNILLAKSGEELDLIGAECRANMTSLRDRTTVPLAHIAAVAEDCIIAQRVLEWCAARGADIKAQNGFGFSALHHVAGAGMGKLLAALASEEHVDLHSKNTLAQTALHIAVSRWAFPEARLLVSRGLEWSTQDRFGRTAAEIACMHRMPMETIESLVQDDVTCDTPTIQQPSRDTPPNGGWKMTQSAADVPATCDFDVVVDLPPHVFLKDYLSVQRPVLIRGGATGGQWDILRRRWQRQFFFELFGDIEQPVGSIPYAQAFGVSGANMTLLSLYKEYLDDAFEAQSQGIELADTPQYVFTSIGKASALLDDVTIPPSLNTKVTELKPRNIQFYVGPADSGAPMHSHSGAWNALVYGKKHWFVSPPPFASYSLKPVREWVKEDLPDKRAQGHVFECIQEAGDVLFVPQAWSHAVHNLAESVGFASEFVWGAAEFGLDEPQE